uniref:Maternal effect embryo arrest 60 n=1 Tax=Gossypium raimondii TaxID=29730 RepID=A0A0D2PQ05_GOSRA|nr:hypothetical protein B456_001G113500 [Gossypium raimondii]
MFIYFPDNCKYLSVAGNPRQQKNKSQKFHSLFLQFLFQSLEATINSKTNAMFWPKYMFSPPPSSAPSPSVRLGHKISITTIHVMALDGIVNVNSLFTFAIFLGLAWYPIPTLIDPSSPASCAAGSNIAENLISCHVYSFSSFLFSSLIALAIKQAIKISKDSNDLAAHGVGASLVDVNLMALRVGMLVSSFGSVLGCGFLMMALVALVQIKLGTLGCGSIYTFAAIGPLCTDLRSFQILLLFIE